MISKQLTFTHLYRVIKILCVSICGMFFCALLWLIYTTCQLGKFSELPSQPPSYCLPKTRSSTDFDAIGEGALTISSSCKNFPLPDLTKEMFFLGKNTRPDATIYDLLIHVGLKESQQSLRAVSGQKLYLTYVEGVHPRLEFSSMPTPLWIMPYLSETGETLAELGTRLLSDKHGKLVEESKTFEIDHLFEKKGSSSKRDLPFQEAIVCLEKGIWWDPDLLFALYGGEKYQKLQKDQRIELSYKNASYMIYAKEGNYLIWKEGRWENAKLGKNSRGAFLAHICRITSHLMEIEVWNEDGLEKTLIALSKKPSPLMDFRKNTSFSSFRQRTKSKVSCRVENKALILKVGDWLFHTSRGWRVLKSIDEMQEVLTFQSRGELFVFDGIEKEGGNSFFVGTFFNLLRTQSSKVKIPITIEPKSSHSSHKKKIISSKIGPKYLDRDLTCHSYFLTSKED